MCDSLQLQLKGIKTVIRNQAYETQYQHLLFEQDSLNQLKKLTRAQKTISGEDRLRMRIYDLQSDSLYHERLALQHRAEAAFNDIDSSWMHPVYGPFTLSPPVIPSPPILDSIQNRPDSGWELADTLDEEQIHGLPRTLKQLQSNPRYEKDSSYRHTIDSLNQKLAQYESIKKSGPEQNRDKHAADTAAAANDLDTLKAGLKKNNDSLAALQQVLQQTRDSAAYYKHMALSVSESTQDAAEKKTKWYQRVLPGHTRTAEKISQDESARIDEREKYYDAQLRRLNDQVSLLQQRNLTLSNDYNRNRQGRTERVYTAVQPVAGAGTRHEDNEVYALRNDINALRNQLILQQAVVPGADHRTGAGIHNNSVDTVYLKCRQQAVRLPYKARPRIRSWQPCNRKLPG